ncbi:universal stress protein [Leptolyngbya sp. FACHB-711]|jgi:nucleotide-binding universal stress UspA family protein|uniref:universal stress protein n=1 Tax=unclassified Leptolyngbya TaxID=2650499 RepID=UPI0016832B0B|nr:universal stress protein [Leptolyngbya sp. FACHB-711]MBD1851146.1 universal stress protein [Cyanobacteria bacterium FACHB-502]MBD2027230.1 universal stress protein [Leptolyngbya sp. FACHB-711]
MIEKILLANSGMGHTEEMLKALMEVPMIQHAKVTVLHVVSPQVTAEGMTQKWEEGGKILANAIQTLNLDPAQVNAVLREGDPKDIVCRVAEEIDTDLIIMGSRGLKRIQSILENSVSQYVFQLASRPMLLVKDELFVKKISRVMVALDKSDASKDSLKLAISLVRDIKNGQLILVHANSDLKLKPGEIAANPNEDPVLIPAITEAKKQGINYKCVAPEGKPGERICQVAEELNVDLLILGSPDRRPSIAKGLPDLDRLLGQSLSDYVRVYANCPVLLVRSGS